MEASVAPAQGMWRVVDRPPLVRLLRFQPPPHLSLLYLPRPWLMHRMATRILRGNQFAQRQSLPASHVEISTIDSFCWECLRFSNFLKVILRIDRS